MLIDRTGSAVHVAPAAQPALSSLDHLEPVLQRWNGADGRGTGIGAAAADGA
ncbi:MAG: hypothetical protein OXH96_21555 [Spirochaetaceae bacterium]|nr:hypothetical protein [Spirochaetaceae bacterium]